MEMTITNLELLAKLISTAQATYGTLSKIRLKNTLIDEKGAAKFTDKEADEFVSQYMLIDQQPNTGSGFSAALFKDIKTNEYVLAIRGTEGIINKDLLSADLADIGITGFANHQAVDLYRYWKMLTTPAGKPVTYSSTEATMLYNMRNGATSTKGGVVI